MDSLLDEMQRCKSVEACMELALTDAYGKYEQAAAWHVHRGSVREIRSGRSDG
jgi:hypothetical protein